MTTRLYINSVGVGYTVIKGGGDMNITVYVRLINVETARNLKFSSSPSIKNTKDDDDDDSNNNNNKR
jgi:hypothetical protein